MDAKDCTKIARPRNLTRGDRSASEVPGAGRELLRRVMAGLRVSRDSTLFAWCRESGFSFDQTRAGLLGASRGDKAVTGALAAMKAAGLDRKKRAA